MDQRVKEPLGPRPVLFGITNSMRVAEMLFFEFQKRHMGKKSRSCAEAERIWLTFDLTSDIQVRRWKYSTLSLLSERVCSPQHRGFITLRVLINMVGQWAVLL